MATNSPQSEGRDGALSSLTASIGALNLCGAELERKTSQDRLWLGRRSSGHD